MTQLKQLLPFLAGWALLLASVNFAGEVRTTRSLMVGGGAEEGTWSMVPCILPYIYTSIVFYPTDISMMSFIQNLFEINVFQ